MESIPRRFDPFAADAVADGDLDFDIAVSAIVQLWDLHGVRLDDIEK